MASFCYHHGVIFSAITVQTLASCFPSVWPFPLHYWQASMSRHLQAAGSPSPLRTLSLSTRFLLCYVQLHVHETTISASLVVSHVPFYISQLPTCQSFPPGFYAYCRLHHACFESDIRY